MTKRQRTVCSHIPRVKTFADVGCDHGYMAKFALDNGLCDFAYLTDVSRGSLSKAEQLLKRQIAEGRAQAFCCDGMNALPQIPDCALIAGMGGEEIVKILSERLLPRYLVLQPMKNAEKVREFLLSNGHKITADYTFEDGKFYDMIVSERGEDCYTLLQIRFGRDNLSHPSQAFVKRLNKEGGELRVRLTNDALSEKSRQELLNRLSQIEEANDEIKAIL